jgi:hypothetical protein
MVGLQNSLDKQVPGNGIQWKGRDEEKGKEITGICNSSKFPDLSTPAMTGLQEYS